MFKLYVIIRVKKNGEFDIYDTVAGIELVQDRLRKARKIHTKHDGVCDYTFYACKCFAAYP